MRNMNVYAVTNEISVGCSGVVESRPVLFSDAHRAHRVRRRAGPE